MVTFKEITDSKDIKIRLFKENNEQTYDDSLGR